MKITFATFHDGKIVGDRSSGTMPYTHAVISSETTDGQLRAISWHLSYDGAVKASRVKFRGTDKPVRPDAKIVPAIPVKVSGAVKADSPNADVWQPLWDAAMAYSAAEMGHKRDAVLAEADAAKQAANLDAADAILAEGGGVPTTDGGLVLTPADAEAIDNGANPNQSPAVVRQMFAGLGWSVTEPVDLDVEVVEPIVTVTADGDAQPVDGLARPIVKETRENMAACAAVGLSYWSGHPASGHVWAIDAHQAAHTVRIDRKHGLVAIGQNSRIADRLGNPVSDDVVSWSIDGPLETQATLSDAANELINAAASDQDISPKARAAVIGNAAETPLPTERLSAPRLGNLESVNHAIAEAAIVSQTAAQPVATAVLSAAARRAMLADMVRDALGTMVDGMTPEQVDALGDAEAVTAQLKMWLRRSGRALIYGDGKGIRNGDAD